jgi:hypothetical protein
MFNLRFFVECAQPPDCRSRLLESNRFSRRFVAETNPRDSGNRKLPDLPHYPTDCANYGGNSRVKLCLAFLREIQSSGGDVSAEKLLEDFWSDVESVLKEKGTRIL